MKETEGLTIYVSEEYSRHWMQFWQNARYLKEKVHKDVSDVEERKKLWRNEAKSLADVLHEMEQIARTSCSRPAPSAGRRDAPPLRASGLPAAGRPDPGPVAHRGGMPGMWRARAHPDRDRGCRGYPGRRNRRSLRPARCGFRRSRHGSYAGVTQ